MSGKIAGNIFPAPEKPVYKARFSVPDTSSNKPFIDIENSENTTPPRTKIYFIEDASLINRANNTSESESTTLL